MKPLIERLTKLQSTVSTAIAQLELASQRATLSTLDAQMAEPTFWSDPAAAEAVSREAAGLREELLLWDTLQSDIATARELAEMSDDSSEAEFKDQVKELETRTEAAMIAVKLSGSHDRRPAIMQISAGAGGTDAADMAGISHCP